MVASASGDGTVRLWDPSMHRQIRRPLRAAGEEVRRLTFSPDGRTLIWRATTSSSCGMCAGTARLGRLPTAGTDSGYELALSPDGSTLASGGWDHVVRLWDVGRRRLRASLAGHGDSITALAFNADGATLASSGEDEAVRLWDLRTGRQLGGPLARAGCV
jgi:WD40 repeat protein